MAKPVYRHRKPQATPHYQCVEDLFETFQQVYKQRFERRYGYFRPYVMDVMGRYLDCGLLHNGFARIRCEHCHYEHLCTQQGRIPPLAGVCYYGYYSNAARGRRHKS